MPRAGLCKPSGVTNKGEARLMHLDAFMEARVDEDERRAKEAMGRAPLEDSRLGLTSEGLVGATGWRVLAEAALKREILFAHHDVPARHDRSVEIECFTCKEPYPCQTLRIAAAVYSDHPRYNPEWKPAEDASAMDD